MFKYLISQMSILDNIYALLLYWIFLYCAVTVSCGNEITLVRWTWTPSPELVGKDGTGIGGL